MLCSVVIPTIGRDTLTRALTSVLEGGLPETDYEVIIVNDAGVPLEIASQLPANVTVLNTCRMGVCVACNSGAAAACGKYLKFLHDDDYLLPGGLASLVQAAESGDAVLVVGGQREVSDDGSLLLTIEKPGLAGNTSALWAVGEVLVMSQCLIRREAFAAVGGFDPLIRISEDRDLIYRLSMVGATVSADRVVACIRVACGPGSAFASDNTADNIAKWSRRVRERAFDAPGALPRLRDSVQANPFLRGRLCRNYVYSAVLNVIDRRFLVAVARLTSALGIAGFHLFQISFWRGVFYHPPWAAQPARGAA